MDQFIDDEGRATPGSSMSPGIFDVGDPVCWAHLICPRCGDVDLYDEHEHPEQDLQPTNEVGSRPATRTSSDEGFLS